MMIIESRRLRLTVDPACGGKLRSLLSKRSGKEFFYQDRREAFDGTRGYSYRDIGGFDECFPAVAACKGETPDGACYEYADHGFLWQNEWRAQPLDHGLLMTCCVPQAKCTFTRRCAFETEDCLLLEYRIANDGRSPVPYVYSAHPLLSCSEQSRVILPQGMVRAFIYAAADNWGLSDGRWYDLPLRHQSDICGPFRLERRTFVKLFSNKLEQGRAAVEHPDSQERLELTFDAAALPYLGVFVQQGFDALGDGHFSKAFLLGLEPATGIGDDVATCIQTHTLHVLESGASVSFWIRISVVQLEEE